MHLLKYTLYILIFYCNISYCDNTILVIGDSLSSAHGISRKAGWVNLLREKINNKYIVKNASISGETTKGGLKRLPKLLEKHAPSHILLALGSNDGLRGTNPKFIKSNLSKIIELSKQNSIKIILIGFQLPINYGETYRDRFKEIFSELSTEYNIPLVPFLLDGFADDLSFFQNDGLHPTTEAQSIMLANVWNILASNL